MPETDKLNDLAKKVKAWGLELGFQQVAISQPDLSAASNNLLHWLDKGYQGSMQWMGEHGEKRYTPDQLVERTLRVISVRMDYLTDSNMIAVLKDDNKAYISRYALGRDYHKLIRKRLAKLGNKIESEIDVGKRAVHVVTTAILEFQDMFYEKWHINVYYQGLQNQVGKSFNRFSIESVIFF